MTENEVIEIVNSIIKRLCKNYVFGYHQDHDIAQEAWIFAIDALDRFDGKRPLENFLFVHIRNRLTNLRRDKFTRKDIPCKTCQHYRPNEVEDNKCAFFERRMDCPEFNAWKQRNQAKKELCAPNSNINDSSFLDYDDYQEVEIKQLKSMIDKNLDVSLRDDYLKMLSGVSIPKGRRTQIENAIKSIISRREEIWSS